MIDSIGFFIPEASINSDCLSGIKPLMKREGFRGSLMNLVITQEYGGVYVKGSLPKFLNGENASSLTRQDLREALGKIETETGLDTHIAQVRQLEIGATLSVDKPPRRYLETWGTVSRYTKDIYGNGKTVTYHTKSRSFSGYDKGAEMAPEALPLSFAGRYGLKLELRFQKGLKPLIGRFLSPWEVLEAEYYNGFIERWKQFYFTIPKQRLVVIGMEEVTPKKLERSLASCGLQLFGLDKLNASIMDGQKNGLYNSANASRMRQLIHVLSEDDRVSSSAPLTIEIDEKVEAANLSA